MLTAEPSPSGRRHGVGGWARLTLMNDPELAAQARAEHDWLVSHLESEAGRPDVAPMDIHTPRSPGG
jgi:hypothetical protein